jgi:serine/threonine-protein kinase
MTALNERYELGHRIGGGGMADVVEAYDRKLGRRVAVKLLRNGSGDPSAPERFAREGRMAAGFTHPNVVTVYDVGDADGQHYLVMELIEGRTLADVIAERGPLPVDEALATTDALLAALSAAHERGLVHRDVKPANVLIGGDGRVKLADFGIAVATQHANAGLTATGQMMGTPTYLSPEQVAGREATPRTDLYAVGVVLYELLAGAPPFRGDHAVAVALAHRDDPVPPLETMRADLPPGLADVVGRALEKDPADRFADAPEMRAALGAIRTGAVPLGDDATLPTARPGTTQALPAAAAAAALEPAQPSPRPRTQRRRTQKQTPSAAAVLTVLLVAALVGGGIAVLLSRGDEGSLLGGVFSEPVVPSASAVVTTLPPTTTTTIPTTIDGLIALLAADPTQYGTRGPDLLEALLRIRDHPDPKGKQTERLVDDIEEWVADDELDPSIGALALHILGVSTQDFSSDQQGGGNGED